MILTTLYLCLQSSDSIFSGLQLIRELSSNTHRTLLIGPRSLGCICEQSNDCVTGTVQLRSLRLVAL